MQTTDFVLMTLGIGLIGAFVYIIWGYLKGLKGSPYELWLLYLAKVLEYSAYGAMNMSFVLYLSADCGLSDISAGFYIGTWSTFLTLITMMVGAVVDAIGIRKTLLIGTGFLLFSRFFMPWLGNVYSASILGFFPMAFGIAIMGPVLSVGIKRYCTKEGAALGFGLFYTLMNVGWAMGGLIFDWVRRGVGRQSDGTFKEYVVTQIPVLHIDLSTYQVIFLVGFLLTLPTLALILLFRDGVERKDDGEVVVTPKVNTFQGSSLSVLYQTIAKAARDTVDIFASVVRERAFWHFMFMLGILVFVRLVFYHFHYTFPKYGVRVLGEGVKIGNIYGVLNPVMIVFLVPLVATLTRKVSSYKVMMVGTFISALSVFIATMPAEIFAPLMDTWLGDLVLNRWLEVPVAQQTPLFLALVVFIAVFTIGESLWSPRLMQFTAEIAPHGREGSYIALSYLPYFAAKFLAGPLSGELVAAYTPEGAASYPDHYMVWMWIGGMALISPIGLVVFRRLFARTGH